MENRGAIAVRVAKVLSVFEYAAISMLVLALVARLTKIPDGGIFCMMGISLLALTPLVGVAIAGISSAKGKRKNMLPCAIIIVIVYAAALILAR
jgi:hypothetical protein